MPLVNFLKLVLPNEGVKCWVSIVKNGPVINHFCHSFDELAEQIRASDATGVDTYHACAAYATDRNRRAGNTLGMQSFWIDIDVGEGKPYATQEDAIQAADAFADRIGIPVPALVRSGGGIHVYWTLDRMFPTTEWLPVAARLKLLAQSHGLLSNPSDLAIISDAARILRPPETHNYKIHGQPRLVSIDDIELFERLPCDEFIQSILNAPLGDNVKKINSPLIGKDKDYVDTVVIPVAGIASGLLPPASANGFAASGNTHFAAGISKAFDATIGAEKGSRGSTRVKYAGELVAKGFSAEEIMPKLLAWDALCQPPEGEAACLHSMKSAFNMHAAKHPAPALPETAVAEAPQERPKLPHGYKWGPAMELMVSVKKENEKGEKEESWYVVSRRAVYLEAILNREHFESDNSYLFMQYHKDKGWIHISMNSMEMEGNNWHAYWFQRGGGIVPGMGKHFKTYVGEASDMLRLHAKEQTRYSQFGWKDDDKSFLIGNNLVHSDGRTSKAIGTDKLAPLMETMRPSRNGSLAMWTAAANKLGGLGMELHLFMLVSSFAAPLMKFCVDEGNGGSVISIVSEGSGKGKTPMTLAMSSVWGEMASVRSTKNTTGNRLIEDLVRRRHLPQVQEEMSYNDPIVACADVEKFTTGQDRGRLNQRGEATGIAENYCTMMVSVSNKSLLELVKMKSEPMSRRIFEIEINEIDKQVLNNLGGIARDMMANCGHAGLQYARMLTEPQVHQYISECLRGGEDIGRVQHKYRDLLQTDPEHRFIVWAVSAIEVAARILVNYGIVTFDVERLMAWVVEHAQMRIAGKSTAPKGVASISKFLSEHLIDYCLTVQGPFTAGKPCLPLKEPRHQLGIRLEISPARMFIAHDLIQGWCVKQGVSFENFGRNLAATGIVVERSKQVTLGAGTNYATGRVTCWELDMSHPDMSGIPMLVRTVQDAAKVGAK